MGSFLFEQARLPGGWAPRVHVAVDADGWITECTPNADEASAESIGGCVIPGLTNLHSHAFQRAMAGMAERGSPTGDTFWSWRTRMYESLSRMTPEDMGVVAEQLYIEMLLSGFTSTVEFHYVHNDVDGRRYEDPGIMSWSLIEASRRAGMALTLAPTLYQTSAFGGAPPEAEQRRFTLKTDAFLDLHRAVGVALESDPDRGVGLGLHSLRAVPPEALQECVQAVREVDPNQPVHIHVAEQEREVEACLAWCGQRPVEWLFANQDVDPHWTLIHATHINATEIASLAGSGTVVGLCPTTEANLGDGVFPLAEFLGQGGRLGVGSDSQVSRSPAEELRMLEYGQRLVRRERNVATRGEDASTGARLFDLAALGGAQAAGRTSGQIAVGYRADWVVLDADHPSLAGRSGDAILDSWIFAASTTPVRDVMVGGRWVVRDGQHSRQEPAAGAYLKVAEHLASRG